MTEVNGGIAVFSTLAGVSINTGDGRGGGGAILSPVSAVVVSDFSVELSHENRKNA